jgi:leukotriene-A4 hydrolase
MSGLRISPLPEQTPAPGHETEYSFKQPCAIPSYLIAIASGEVVYRPFESLDGKKWKTGCWAEVSSWIGMSWIILISQPDTIEAAFWEFKKDTAK